MHADLITKLLASIAADNLVAFCGAGLSMASPSSVPSARTVAAETSEQYKLQTGVALPANAPTDLEVLSSFALARGDLRKLILQKLIRWQPFIRNPNDGHFALADFLGAQIIEFGISTNFDTLIELAAENLGEPLFEAALDGIEAGKALSHHPLLKIHGCCRRDKDQTLWCRQQLDETTIKNRVSASKTWLQGQLKSKDLLFVGFWSDWDYLNHVIEDCIGATEPSLVVLVDPMDAAGLATKAPNLWAWANSGKFQFHHARASGAEFLDELRKEFSIKFLEQLLAQSSKTFTALTGKAVPAITFDKSKSSADFYALRRDYGGVPGNQIVRDKRPPNTSSQVGAMHLRLIAKGAKLDEPRFVLDGNRIRIVQGAGQVLSLVQSSFSQETPPPLPDQIVICAGAADDGGVPAHLLRSGTTPSIVRSPAGGARWVTNEIAIADLKL